MENIYATGRGSFKVRAVWNYLKKEHIIEVTQIPYTTTSEAIIDKMTELIKAGKLKEVSDVRDETGLQGLKIASLWKDSATYPVLFIDFSMAGEDVDGFEKKLMTVIKDECDAKGIAYSPDAESVSVLMMSIARAASPASLVLLIDRKRAAKTA